VNIIITPNMTIADIAHILEQNKGRNVECYIRVETIRGKCVAYLVREPRIPILPTAPQMTARQAD